jgi:hypothetical protein
VLASLAEVAPFLSGKADTTTNPESPSRAQTTKPNRRFRSQSRFRKRDIRVAVEAAFAAGMDISRVEVDTDGRIVVVSKAGAAREASLGGENPWDQATADLGGRNNRS